MIIDSYRFGSSGTITYTSDFSAGVDGWSGDQSTVDGNIDTDADGAGQPPSDNWLRSTSANRTFWKAASTLFTTMFPDMSGTYNITADFYFPAGSYFLNHSNGLDMVFLSSFQSFDYNESDPTVAGLYTLTWDFTLSGASNSELKWGAAAQNSAGELNYIKNIIVTQTA